jgi:hypothetical protein
MQVTVNIPDELAAQVRARGISPEKFVDGLIEDAARVTQNGSSALPQRDLREFFSELRAHSAKIPQLPDEAFTRESFYQDRD